MPERDLALDALELGQPLVPARAAAQGRVEGRAARGRGSAAADRADEVRERDRGEREHVDVQDQLRCGRCSTSSSTTSDERQEDGQRRRPERRRASAGRRLRAAPRALAARSCSASARAASRSSRTVSSASIACSFISGPTACCENLALSKRSVSLRAAAGADRELAEHPPQVLERRLRRVPREPVRGEHPLEPRVGGDHGAARVGLGAQVVERLVDGGRERVATAGRGAARRGRAAAPAPGPPEAEDRDARSGRA